MLSAAIIFIILFVLEIAYISFARKNGIVALPNERSSHRSEVVSGGGIIFFFALLVWWIWNGFAGWSAITAFALLALVSFVDDMREVAVRVRLAVQFIAVALLVWSTGMMPESVGLWLVAIVAGVGMINAFNFMDGINGGLGSYALVLFLACAYINLYVYPDFVPDNMPLVMVMACVVFIIFNFRKSAVCFSGDVGSIVAGAVSFYILLRLILVTGNPGWLVLVAVYGVDVILTLCRRLLRRQNIFRAHRMHAYQLACNELGRSHLAVACFIVLLQILIDIPPVLWGIDSFSYLIAVCVVLAVGYTVIVRYSRRKPRF